MTKRVEPQLVERFLEEVALDAAALAASDALTLAAPPAELPASLRARLSASLAVTNRFDDLEQTAAALADLSVAQARALLARVDDPSTSWESTEMPGISIFHFEGGPAVHDAVTGFVRHAPGTQFPEHDHVRGEHVLVLQGAFEDSDGTVYRSGEVATRGTGTPHSYRAIGPLPLITMAIVDGGVRIGGTVIPPRDPRA